MRPKQSAIDCPNPACATPAVLGLCTRFSQGFGLQLGVRGTSPARWDDTHCLVCGHFSSPYAAAHNPGRDLREDREWLAAVERALSQTRAERLSTYLAIHEMGIYDLLAMRNAVQGLRELSAMAASAPKFPHVGVLRVQCDTELPDVFGIDHGEAESEPFARKVRVLGRLLGAGSAETSPRHCMRQGSPPAWYFYSDRSFIGLLDLEPNRGYRGHITIDGCLERLLHSN
jgi:hypothetical protein